MIFIYNFLQFILLSVTFPFLLLLILGREKYRGRILARLGFGLPRVRRAMPVSSSGRIWIHCLSVGEVTSAIPLIRDIRRRLPDTHLSLTVATAAGMKIAQNKITPYVDLILAGPLDFLPTVNMFLKTLRPDLFILVETDFWPNWLAALRRRQIPAVLVNGRISASSHRNYHRLRFFFAPLLSWFSLLCMQTEADAKQMLSLGVPAKRLQVLGNLKYDTGTDPGSDTGPGTPFQYPGLSADAAVFLCGSTHPGEEEILLAAFARLRNMFPDLLMIIAPRDPGRGRAVAALAEQRGLTASLRTTDSPGSAVVFVLDTLGELTQCYRLARIAFIGGSLVPCGGHNPLEAAAHGVPILFGPHMNDFHEIARDLVHCGAAAVVSSAGEIQELATEVLDNERTHARMSSAATGLIRLNRGVTQSHADRIVMLLGDSGRS